jgi:hypothetical protein
MKTKLFTFLLLTCALTTSFGQELKEDKVDKFTKKAVKKTSWEKLIGKGGMSSLSTNYRISKIDNDKFFELKMMMNNKVYSVNKGDKIIFLFTNDETVELSAMETQVASKGAGATGYVGSEGWGTHTIYQLTEENISKFKTNIIKSVRIYTSEKYVEDDVSDKLSKAINKCLELIN